MLELPDIPGDSSPDSPSPRPVSVRIGEHWVDAFAHGSRIGRRGRQVLISQGNYLVWVLAARVRPRTAREPRRDRE